MTDRLLTPQKAAERLAITVEQLHDLVRDGELVYIAVGRGKKRPRRRFTEADLTDFIERRRRREVGQAATVSRGNHRSAMTPSLVGFSALRSARLERRRKP
jgi:excisionase family DNA binding protein